MIEKPEIPNGTITMRGEVIGDCISERSEFTTAVCPRVEPGLILHA
jgi:hypothetical protein